MPLTPDQEQTLAGQLATWMFRRLARGQSISGDRATLVQAFPELPPDVQQNPALIENLYRNAFGQVFGAARQTQGGWTNFTGQQVSTIGEFRDWQRQQIQAGLPADDWGAWSQFAQAQGKSPQLTGNDGNALNQATFSMNQGVNPFVDDPGGVTYDLNTRQWGVGAPNPPPPAPPAPPPAAPPSPTPVTPTPGSPPTGTPTPGTPPTNPGWPNITWPARPGNGNIIPDWPSQPSQPPTTGGTTGNPQLEQYAAYITYLREQLYALGLPQAQVQAAIANAQLVLQSAIQTGYLNGQPTLDRDKWEDAKNQAWSAITGYIDKDRSIPSFAREQWLQNLDILKQDQRIKEGGLTGFYNGQSTLARELGLRELMLRQAQIDADLRAKPRDWLKSWYFNQNRAAGNATSFAQAQDPTQPQGGLDESYQLTPDQAARQNQIDASTASQGGLTFPGGPTPAGWSGPVPSRQSDVIGNSGRDGLYAGAGGMTWRDDSGIGRPPPTSGYARPRVPIDTNWNSGDQQRNGTPFTQAQGDPIGGGTVTYPVQPQTPSTGRPEAAGTAFGRAIAGSPVYQSLSRQGGAFAQAQRQNSGMTQVNPDLPAALTGNQQDWGEWRRARGADREQYLGLASAQGINDDDYEDQIRRGLPMAGRASFATASRRF